MKADTWFPFYVADYRKDTGRLTCEQHGAYCLLLMEYWVSGPPPDDDVALAQITHLELRQWRKMRPVLLRYFSISDGEWRQKRADEELEKAKRLTEARRQNGQKGGRPRKLTESEEKPADNLEVNLGPKLDETPTRVAPPSPSPLPSEGRELTLSLIEAPSSLDIEFEAFWQLYPKKVGKIAARKAYAKARKSVGDTTIRDGLKRTKFSDDHRFIPHPATWLNEGRWMDVPAEPAPAERRYGFV